MVNLNLVESKTQQLSECMKAIRAMWAKNGDEISKQYAGTGSTCTEVTMNEKTSLKGKISHKLTSVERFFKNNINTKDDNRQECIDLFIGNHKRSQSMVTHHVEAKMVEAQVEYSQVNAYTMGVFTWNLAGNEPRYEMDFTNILKSDKFTVAPDIFILGFQETGKLNAINILKGHDKGRVECLKSYAQEALDDLDRSSSYTFFAQSAMVGLLIIGFGKSELIGRISDVLTTKVKTGLGGSMGNKGAVLGRFNLDDTSFIAAGTHLESGQKKEKERAQQFKDIITNAFSDKGSKYKYMDHTIKLFFGDLNFRINLSYGSVLNTIEDMTESTYDEQLHILLNNDQLNQNKLDYKWLYCFREMPINFLPTFKYDKNSNTYDTSKKQRVPSWCDRILWYQSDKDDSQSQKIIHPVIYERRETTYSDHKPVVAYLELRCNKHNSDRKDSFKRKVVQKISTAHTVKKPVYEDEETKLQKDFNMYAAFGIPNDVPDEHIHLDLDFNNDKGTIYKEEIKEEIEDFITMKETPSRVNPFSDDLIDMATKDDGNLIDFSSTHAFTPSFQTANRYFHQNTVPNNGYAMNNHAPIGSVASPSYANNISLGYQQYPMFNRPSNRHN